MRYEELVGEEVEHPEHGRGIVRETEKLYPHLLVELEAEDTGRPPINPHEFEDSDWRLVHE